MKIIEKEMAQLVAVINEPLEEGKEAAFTVRGNSMWPLLLSGRDKITVRKSDKYRKYDIVLYRRENGSFVLHRIVGRKKDAFVLAGDGELEKEYPIYPSQILAKAVSGVRKGKTFSCSAFCFKVYSVLWVKLFYVRAPLTRTGVALKRWLKRVRKA
ncbi:MAG: S24 family peptidase [Clostridia bacterium]|nr:S24 family peptidase [Clostridia bacterium]